MSSFLARLARWVTSLWTKPPREAPRKIEERATRGQPEPETRMVSAAPVEHASSMPAEPYATVPSVEEEPPVITTIPQKETDVFIGLDFGTAGTKVIVRAPFIAGGWAAAVDFGPMGHPSCSFILPSVVHTDADGRAAFGQGNRDGHGRPDSLKVRLMDGDAGSQVEAVAFLALVIRHARDWFCREHLKILAPRKPRWRANLGIPSAGYDDDRIRTTFGRAISAAWTVAFQDGPVTAQAAGGALDSVRVDGDQSPLGTIPEVVAQVHGYARSHHRQNGLHLLVDVGASTLDVCAFVLHDARAEDNYELLNAVVESLGALELHRMRIECLGDENCASSVFALDELDPFCRIPEAPLDYLVRADRRRRDILLGKEGDFRRQCVATVFRSLRDVRKKRDPNSPRWQEGLSTFLCGGGSEMKLYQKVISGVSQEIRSQWLVAPLRVKPLPRPIALSHPALNDALFHRLSVAYGLAFEKFDIGTINRPSDIGDVAPMPRRRPRDFTSKDQV